VQEPAEWRVARNYYNYLGEIRYPSTTSDQSNNIGSSIRLKAPTWPPESRFPILVSLDSIVLGPGDPSENSRYARVFRLLKTSRDEATKLHFVILGVSGEISDYESAFGLILAPSKVCAGTFVRLGIWSNHIGRLSTQTLAVKFEYMII
jgi:hypothetical protein